MENIKKGAKNSTVQKNTKSFPRRIGTYNRNNKSKNVIVQLYSCHNKVTK